MAIKVPYSDYEAWRKEYMPEYYEALGENTQVKEYFYDMNNPPEGTKVTGKQTIPEMCPEKYYLHHYYPGLDPTGNIYIEGQETTQIDDAEYREIIDKLNFFRNGGIGCGGVSQPGLDPRFFRYAYIDSTAEHVQCIFGSYFQHVGPLPDNGMKGENMYATDMQGNVFYRGDLYTAIAKVPDFGPL